MLSAGTDPLTLNYLVGPLCWLGSHQQWCNLPGGLEKKQGWCSPGSPQMPEVRILPRVVSR